MAYIRSFDHGSYAQQDKNNENKHARKADGACFANTWQLAYIAAPQIKEI